MCGRFPSLCKLYPTSDLIPFRLSLVQARVQEQASQSDTEEIGTEESEIAITIMEHFEDIVNRVIAEANDREKWMQVASEVEVSENRLALDTFMGESIFLMAKFARSTTGRGGIKTVFDVLISVEEKTQALPALMSGQTKPTPKRSSNDEEESNSKRPRVDEEDEDVVAP